MKETFRSNKSADKSVKGGPNQENPKKERKIVENQRLKSYTWRIKL